MMRKGLCTLSQRALVALIGFGLVGQAIAAPGDIVQRTATETWNNASGATQNMTWPGNITAGNFIVCGVMEYDSAGDPTLSGASDTASNTYTISASSPDPTHTTRVFLVTAPITTGGVTITTLNGLLASARYGHAKCAEMAGPAASPVDQTCNATDPVAQANDARCTLGTLSQANERIFSVVAMGPNAGGANANITGPTGICTWANEHVFQDATSILADSFDTCLTSGTTGGNVQYAHEDISGDEWAVAAVSVKLAAASSAWWHRRRRMR